MKKEHYFWLDDERPNPDPSRYQHFMAAPELIEKLMLLGPDLSQVVLRLDHDLGVCRACSKLEIVSCAHRGNGYDVILFLEEQVHNNPAFIMPIVRLHSGNPMGKARMQAGLVSIDQFLAREE